MLLLVLFILRLCDCCFMQMEYKCLLNSVRGEQLKDPEPDMKNEDPESEL